MPVVAGCVADSAAWRCCRYDQCFDRWYKDVFLQQKADGRVGCQEEYKAYSKCFLVRVLSSLSLVLLPYL